MKNVDVKIESVKKESTNNEIQGAIPKSKNLDALKEKLRNSLGEKSTITSNSGLYKIPLHHIENDSVKSYRRNVRNTLDNFYKKIVLSGKVNDNLFEDLERFANFYKENWLIQDFKIDSFTNVRDDIKRSQRLKLLNVLKEYIELK